MPGLGLASGAAVIGRRRLARELSDEASARTISPCLEPGFGLEALG